MKYLIFFLFSLSLLTSCETRHTTVEVEYQNGDIDTLLIDYRGLQRGDSKYGFYFSNGCLKDTEYSHSITCYVRKYKILSSKTDK